MKVAIRQAVFALVLCAIICSMSTAFAATIIRQDVSIDEARTDITFSYDDALAADQQARATFEWAVWDDVEYTDITHLPIPIGYSAQISSLGEIINVYHYTRTYLDMRALFYDDFRGDSGRVWGYGTVKATGEACDWDVWNLGTHTVKYGVLDN